MLEVRARPTDPHDAFAEPGRISLRSLCVTSISYRKISPAEIGAALKRVPSDARRCELPVRYPTRTYGQSSG